MHTALWPWWRMSILFKCEYFCITLVNLSTCDCVMQFLRSCRYTVSLCFHLGSCNPYYCTVLYYTIKIYHSFFNCTACVPTCDCSVAKHCEICPCKFYICAWLWVSYTVFGLVFRTLNGTYFHARVSGYPGTRLQRCQDLFLKLQHSYYISSKYSTQYMWQNSTVPLSHARVQDGVNVQSKCRIMTFHWTDWKPNRSCIFGYLGIWQTIEVGLSVPNFGLSANTITT